MNIKDFEIFIQKNVLYRSQNYSSQITGCFMYKIIFISFDLVSFVTLFPLLSVYLITILCLYLKNLGWINSLGLITLSIYCIIVSFFTDNQNMCHRCIRSSFKQFFIILRVLTPNNFISAVKTPNNLTRDFYILIFSKFAKLIEDVYKNYSTTVTHS